MFTWCGRGHQTSAGEVLNHNQVFMQEGSANGRLSHDKTVWLICVEARLWLCLRQRPNRESLYDQCLKLIVMRLSLNCLMYVTVINKFYQEACMYTFA